VTTKSNTFESGQPSPTDLTTANSAFPDAVQNVVRSAAGAYVRYTNDTVAHGSLALETGVGATSARAYAEWSMASDAQAYFRINATLGTPTANHRIVQFGRSDGSCMDLELRTDRRLRLRDAYSRNYHETQPLPTNLIRIECFGLFQEGTGSTGLRIYTAADTYELFDSFDGDANGTLRGLPTYLRWGVVDASTNVRHIWDDVRVQPTGYPGPVVPPNLLPTATPQYARATYGTPISLTTAGSDPDGGVIDYTYAIKNAPQGSAVSLVTSGLHDRTATVLSSRPGSVTIRCTMNDNQGGIVDVDHCLEWENIPSIGVFPNLYPAIPVTAAANVPSDWGDPIAYETFQANATKGNFLQAYPLMDAYPTSYTTTHGGSSGVSNGDHYGGNTNLSAQNGVLVMELYREAPGTCLIPGNSTTGHAVGAAPFPKFSPDPDDIYQLYGRYEVRYRVRQQVAGWKTAWLMWPQSEQWPRDGEIDFREGDTNGSVTFFQHNQNGTSGGDQQVFPFPAGTNDGGWHTVVLEWKPNDCAVFSDAVLVGRATSRVPNTPMRMALQTETPQDGTQPGAAPATCTIEVDYIEIRPYVGF
jgi:hypothetical protein